MNIITNREREEVIKDITFEVYSNENNILKILVIAKDTENGIDKLIYLSEQGEEKEIIGQGKSRVALDFEVKENGNYEFKMINAIGEEIVKILTVDDNFRNNLIDINVYTETEIATHGSVTIDYHGNENKKRMYKIGENGVWKDYNGEFEIDSYKIIENNWQNSESKDITIYLKIEDNARNIVQIEKKIKNIDVDISEIPQINILSVDEYPTITKDGIINHSTIEINYDNRDDIRNYYSIDNGQTWTEYTESLNLISATIIAKSVKNESGLEISKKEFINAYAPDAVTAEYYDGSDEWNGYQYDSRYIDVDNSVIGKKLFFNTSYADNRVDRRGTINAIDEDNQIIDTIRFTTSFDYTIIEGTKRLNVKTWNDGIHYTTVNEISLINEPEIICGCEYPIIKNNEFVTDVQININYFDTSVDKKYKIDDGDWKDYTGPVTLKYGETIYAKGYDSSGKETRKVTQYTNNLADDALPIEAYDGDESTTVKTDNYRYIYIDSSMIGKTLNFVIGSYKGAVTIRALDESNEIISTSSAGSTIDYVIPENTTKLHIYTSSHPFGTALISEIYIK